MFRLGLAVVCGAVLLFGLLLAVGSAQTAAVSHATGTTIRYVAPTGNDSGNDCTGSGSPCATIQHAVDAANRGDEIRVATGIYTDVHARPRGDIATTGIVTQVVYISKTVTVRGGFTATNWITPYVVTQPVTLDAQKQGRVLYITGDISPTIEGLHIIGGDADGLVGDMSGFDAGGGIYVITATANFSNNRISNNTAWFGGGLYFLSSANVMLTGNTIAQNEGFTFAGGVGFRNSPGAALTANTISKNVANRPNGGMKSYGGVLLMNSDGALLLANTISGNSAANPCGGLCIHTSDDVTVIDNLITGNSAGTPGYGNGGGGGVNIIGSNDVVLANNIIADSRAITGGGGIDVLQSYNMTLTNNVIADNQSSAEGSGIRTAGTTARMLHSTISSNKGGDDIGADEICCYVYLPLVLNDKSR